MQKGAVTPLRRLHPLSLRRRFTSFGEAPRDANSTHCIFSSITIPLRRLSTFSKKNHFKSPTSATNCNSSLLALTTSLWCISFFLFAAAAALFFFFCSPSPFSFLLSILLISSIWIKWEKWIEDIIWRRLLSKYQFSSSIASPSLSLTDLYTYTPRASKKKEQQEERDQYDCFIYYHSFMSVHLYLCG